MAADWVLVPVGAAEIDAAARRCRRRVTRRAMFAAGVALVPLPGLDLLTDVGVLLQLLPEINAEFGLTPAQIERLAPDRKVAAFKAVSIGGGMLVGRVVTRDLVLTMLRRVGVRLSAQQAAKFVPVAGQAVSAALTFSALKLICEQHIRQCIDIAAQLQPPVADSVL